VPPSRWLTTPPIWPRCSPPTRTRRCRDERRATPCDYAVAT
jgi:hypothetical protein